MSATRRQLAIWCLLHNLAVVILSLARCVRFMIDTRPGLTRSVKRVGTGCD